jgi:ribosomal protein S5
MFKSKVAKLVSVSPHQISLRRTKEGRDMRQKKDVSSKLTIVVSNRVIKIVTSGRAVDFESVMCTGQTARGTKKAA